MLGCVTADDLFLLFIFWIGISPAAYFALMDSTVAQLVADIIASGAIAMPGAAASRSSTAETAAIPEANATASPPSSAPMASSNARWVSELSPLLYSGPAPER